MTAARRCLNADINVTPLTGPARDLIICMAMSRSTRGYDLDSRGVGLPFRPVRTSACNPRDKFRNAPSRRAGSQGLRRCKVFLKRRVEHTAGDAHHRAVQNGKSRKAPLLDPKRAD